MSALARLPACRTGIDCVYRVFCDEPAHITGSGPNQGKFRPSVALLRADARYGWVAGIANGSSLSQAVIRFSRRKPRPNRLNEPDQKELAGRIRYFSRTIHTFIRWLTESLPTLEGVVSTEAAKTIVRKFYTTLFQDFAAAEAYIGADYVDHNNEQAGRGPEVLRLHVAALLKTFPDFRMEVQDIFAEGDSVITRVIGQGTHAGTWMQIEPTGSVVRVKGINIDRVSDGRIVEHWGEADTVGMLVQMGVDPFAGRVSKKDRFSRE